MSQKMLGVRPHTVLGALLLLSLALGAVGLVGCRTADRPAPVSATVPPPNLEARPWGLSHQLLDSVSGNASGRYSELVSPRATELNTEHGREVLAETLRGLKPAREELQGRRANVWLASSATSAPSEGEGSEVVLRFEERSGRWFLTEVVTPERTLR